MNKEKTQFKGIVRIKGRMWSIWELVSPPWISWSGCSYRERIKDSGGLIYYPNNRRKHNVQNVNHKFQQMSLLMSSLKHSVIWLEKARRPFVKFWHSGRMTQLRSGVKQNKTEWSVVGHMRVIETWGILLCGSFGWRFWIWLADSPPEQW